MEPRSTMITLPTSTPAVTRLRDELKPFWRSGRTRSLLDRLQASDIAQLEDDFAVLSHLHQSPPTCANNGGPWTVWLMLAGRGAGKTRAGAEWVRALVQGHTPYAE